MQSSRPKILYATSVSPFFSAGLAADNIRVFESLGYEVDVLTKYKCSSLNNKVIYAIDGKEDTKHRGFFERIRNYILSKKIFAFFFDTPLYRQKKDGVMMAIEDENVPGVPVDLYIDKITDEYEFVVFAFLQGMFSTCSIKAIYDKIKKPIYLSTIDMYLMTGGCYYFGKCNGFSCECMNCKYVKKNMRKTIHQNFLTKKKVMDEIAPTIITNTWTNFLLSHSAITKDVKKGQLTILINDSVFRDLGKDKGRVKFNIPQEKFVILAGCANDSKRKGLKYLVDALNMFSRSLNNCERDRVLVFIIGDSSEDLSKIISLDTYMVGRIDASLLPEVYSMADIYVSPSIDDAGPSMVNQSLMCGTPVVSFCIGTALDVVIDGETGYKVERENSKALADAIELMFRKSREEMVTMRKKSRDLSYSVSSFESHVKKRGEIFCQK